MAARIARHDGKLLGEHIDDLALALIAPLGTEDDGGLALRLVHSKDAPGKRSGESARRTPRPFVIILCTLCPEPMLQHRRKMLSAASREKSAA